MPSYILIKTFSNVADSDELDIFNWDFSEDFVDQFELETNEEYNKFWRDQVYFEESNMTINDDWTLTKCDPHNPFFNSGNSLLHFRDLQRLATLVQSVVQSSSLFDFITHLLANPKPSQFLNISLHEFPLENNQKIQIWIPNRTPNAPVNTLQNHLRTA